jgi:hypothetical protein
VFCSGARGAFLRTERSERRRDTDPDADGAPCGGKNDKGNFFGEISSPRSLPRSPSPSLTRSPSPLPLSRSSALFRPPSAPLSNTMSETDENSHHEKVKLYEDTVVANRTQCDFCDGSCRHNTTFVRSHPMENRPLARDTSEIIKAFKSRRLTQHSLLTLMHDTAEIGAYFDRFGSRDADIVGAQLDILSHYCSTMIKIGTDGEWQPCMRDLLCVLNV